MKYLKLFEEYSDITHEIILKSDSVFTVKRYYNGLLIGVLHIKENVIDNAKIHKDFRNSGHYIDIIRYSLKNIDSLNFLISKKGDNFLDERSALADNFWAYIFSNQYKYGLNITKNNMDYLITLI